MVKAFAGKGILYAAVRPRRWCTQAIFQSPVAITLLNTPNQRRKAICFLQPQPTISRRVHRYANPARSIRIIAAWPFVPSELSPRLWAPSRRWMPTATGAASLILTPDAAQLSAYAGTPFDHFAKYAKGEVKSGSNREAMRPRTSSPSGSAWIAERRKVKSAGNAGERSRSRGPWDKHSGWRQAVCRKGFLS